MTECNHEKIYDPNVIMAMPPRRRWICKKCKERGTDVNIHYSRTLPQILEYARLEKETKKHKSKRRRIYS